MSLLKCCVFWNVLSFGPRGCRNKYNIFPTFSQFVTQQPIFIPLISPIPYHDLLLLTVLTFLEDRAPESPKLKQLASLLAASLYPRHCATNEAESYKQKNRYKCLCHLHYHCRLNCPKMFSVLLSCITKKSIEFFQSGAENNIYVTLNGTKEIKSNWLLIG